MELLARHSEGVIVLTGCLQSRFCRRLVEERADDARAHLDDLIQAFGPDQVYFEVQKNGIDEQDKANEGIVRFARELGRPLVGTADVHYLRREDFDNHAALLCVQTKSTLEAPKLSFDTNEFYIKSSRGNGRVLRRVAGGGADARWRSPSAASSRSSSASCCCRATRPRTARSRRRCCAGSPARACAPATATRPRPRRSSGMEFELGVIEEMGFSSYFLIVWDFVRYAKENGVAVGPGRGSAAGSIVSYALNITDLDPLANDLLFERFLNPGRKSMPDIDIDFSVRGRERMIRYVGEKYGRESVAQIITFGKMAPRAATRDAARVLGFDYATGDRLAKQIPEPIMGRSPSFEECLKPGQELRQTYDAEPDAKRIIDVAQGLEGIIRNNSIHAAAVVIADRPLQEIVPLQLAEDRSAAGERQRQRVRQAGAPVQDRHPVLDGADRGDRAAEDGLPRPPQPRRDRGRDRDHRALARRARSTWTRSRSTTPRPSRCSPRGDSTGVFQLESEGMREAMKKVRPTEFDDIVALVALYRPGAMRYIPAYAKGKKRTRRRSATPTPRLRAITEPTYGCVLYQEQLMEIAKRDGRLHPAPRRTTCARRSARRSAT